MADLLQHGFVKCVCFDNETRQTAISIRAPMCIVQAMLPLLLGHGMLDGFKVSNPCVSWVPPLSRDQFHESAVQQMPDLPERATAALQDRIMDILRVFSDLSCVLKNPDNATYMLPIGIYVEFQLRSTIENVASIVEKTEAIRVAGVQEFRYALASVLAELLAAVGDVEFSREDVPPMLGVFTTSDVALPTSAALPTLAEDLSSKDR